METTAKKPRKKPNLTEEQRQKLRDNMMNNVRPKKGKKQKLADKTVEQEAAGYADALGAPKEQPETGDYKDELYIGNIPADKQPPAPADVPKKAEPKPAPAKKSHKAKPRPPPQEEPNYYNPQLVRNYYAALQPREPEHQQEQEPPQQQYQQQQYQPHYQPQYQPQYQGHGQVSHRSISGILWND